MQQTYNIDEKAKAHIFGLLLAQTNIRIWLSHTYIKLSGSICFVKHSFYETSKTWFYKLPAARFNQKNLIFLIKSFENFQKKPLKYSKISKLLKNIEKNS